MSPARLWQVLSPSVSRVNPWEKRYKLFLILYLTPPPPAPTESHSNDTRLTSIKVGCSASSVVAPVRTTNAWRYITSEITKRATFSVPSRVAFKSSRLDRQCTITETASVPFALPARQRLIRVRRQLEVEPKSMQPLLQCRSFIGQLPVPLTLFQLEHSQLVAERARQRRA